LGLIGWCFWPVKQSVAAKERFSKGQLSNQCKNTTPVVRFIWKCGQKCVYLYFLFEGICFAVKFTANLQKYAFFATIRPLLRH
jgi:hypothetical protein